MRGRIGFATCNAFPLLPTKSTTMFGRVTLVDAAAASTRERRRLIVRARRRRRTVRRLEPALIMNGVDP